MCRHTQEATIDFFETLKKFRLILAHIVAGSINANPVDIFVRGAYCT
jgi:hypothetical protein